MDKQTYVVTKVKNGFIMETLDEIVVYNKASQVSEDLTDGIFTRMLEGEKVEFTAVRLLTGKEKKER